MLSFQCLSIGAGCPSLARVFLAGLQMLEFILKSGLLPMAVSDPEKLGERRPDFAPLIERHLRISRQAHIIVRQATAWRSPSYDQQQEICAMLRRRQMRRVRQIGVCE